LIAASFSLIAAALIATPVLGQQTLLTKDSKRECATCHLDWVDSFERKGAVLLIDRPIKPAAAAEEMCRGCHDGSVGDSRREVWLEHGHRMNEAPTDRIKVPPNMPLEEGKMVCRTCHTAHTVPTAADLSKIVFLRAAKEGGPCQQCHVDRAYGAEHTSHPLAKLPFELPAELKEAHARTDAADRTKMACQTCHTTHGARQDHLLVMGTSSGQLCLACHERLHPMEWKPDAPREHPQNPPLKSAEQRQAIIDLGTRLGPGDTLTCFSCHKMHAAKTGKYMLVDTLEGSRLCVRCHSDRNLVLATKHDLRQSKPLEKNRLDQTAEQSGPCGACHSFHRYAREPKPGGADPSGRCAACHPASGLTERGGLTMAHPVEMAATKVPAAANTAHLKLSPHANDAAKRALTCGTCHDPHVGGSVGFLRTPKDQLCATCHPERAASLAGKHDFTARPELKNARGASAVETGKCGFCHAVHAEGKWAMWVATRASPVSADGLCTQCHSERGPAGRMARAVTGHPTGPKVRPTTQASAALPLFNERGGVAPDGFVACASCHNPHADSEKAPALLRVQEPPSNLCTKCHAASAAMAGGPHDTRGTVTVSVDGKAEDLCISCHRPHSDDAAKQGFAFVPTPGMPRADGACVACHPKQQPGNKEPLTVGQLIHPTTLPAKHEAADGAGLPLLHTAEVRNSIGCKTCHDPHARAGTPKLTRVQAGAATASLCVRCHKAAEPLSRSMHAAEALQAKDSQTCAPCHATHAVANSQKALLWSARDLGVESSNPDMRCVACHTPDPPGRQILVQHPREPLKAVPWSTKRPSTPISDIHCGTCHLAHGEPSAHAVSDLAARRAARPMMRTDGSRQCAYCHGSAAPRVFLYWHETDRRNKENPLPRNKAPNSQ
jgi:predicted CXXCH cytochrome family protein